MASGRDARTSGVTAPSSRILAADSVVGTKRTCWVRLTVSAPESKTDVPCEPGHFRFGPISDIDP